MKRRIESPQVDCSPKRVKRKCKPNSEEVDKDEFYFKMLENVRNSRQPPFQSNFRVVSLIVYAEDPENGNHTIGYEIGCNTECCWLAGSICAERSAITKIYTKLNHHKFKIKRVYLTSDLDAPLLPGVACREHISDYCDDSCMVISRGKNLDITTMKFTDLHPHPYLYGKLPQKEIEGMANQWASFFDFTTNAQWLDLYNKVKETIPQDTTEWHFNKFAAGVLFEDGTISVSPQYKALEYANSMEALASIFCHIKQSGKAAKIVVQVDKLGVCHSPFSQSRVLFVEHGLGDVKVIHHTSSFNIAVTSFKDFYPNCPVWK